MKAIFAVINSTWAASGLIYDFHIFTVNSFGYFSSRTSLYKGLMTKSQRGLCLTSKQRNRWVISFVFNLSYLYWMIDTVLVLSSCALYLLLSSTQLIPVRSDFSETLISQVLTLVTFWESIVFNIINLRTTLINTVC